jgi:outer membrane cobalamin receptor
MPRRLLLFVFTLAVLFGAAASARADEVRGKVLDPQDRPVAGADVLIARGTTIVATARTGSDGTFGPIDVPAGEYSISVAATGLRAAPQALSVKSGSASTIDIHLALAAVSESVVVSSAQVDTPLSRATDSVTVITRADLESRQQQTVAEAMRSVPGFGVVQSGGPGHVTSFFPRGGESDYTLVLVDGIPQNSFGGGFDAAHLTTQDIERVEVVRGPQSALFGGGAIGGIIHVVTRQGGPTRAQGLFEAGGYGTMHESASASGGHQVWSWGGSVDHYSTDGDTRFFDNIGTRVTNADYDRTAASGSVGWSDNPGRRIRFDVRGGQNEGGNPGPYGSDPLGRFFGINTESRGRTTTVEFGASALFGGTSALRHHLQFTFANLKSNFLGDFPSTDRTRRTTGRYQIDLDHRGVGISAGWEGVGEQADNTFVTDAASTEVPIHRFISGLFVEARPDFGSRVLVTTGVRLEYIRRSALASNGFSRPTFEDDVVWSTNPKLAIAWFVRPPDQQGWTKIRGGVGTGIKAPNTFDIAFTDNPDLKPERSKSLDLGIEQALVGSAVVADLTYFANRYNDLIITVSRTGPFAGVSKYRSDNIANARAKGLELGISARARGGFAIRGSWTWLDTEVLGVDGLPDAAPAPYQVGDPLIRRPRQQGSLDLSWTSARCTVFALVNGRGKMADIEPNFGSPVFDNPGYATTTLGGSFKLVGDLEVFGQVMNLFDKSYEEALGFPALGRTALVGVRVASRH